MNIHSDLIKDNLIPLTGIIENIVYHSEDSGYTVFDLFVEESENDEDLITAVGILPFVGEGERVSLMGKWDTHPAYGRQFKVEHYEKQLPTGKRSILKYLSSRAVKGIGPVTASKIVETFGDDTFEVLEKHPELLSNIGGITEAKAKAIGESFREQFGLRSVVMAYGEYFGMSACLKIYKKWGSGAVELVKQNPYILCSAIHGIGFLRADKVAESIGHGTHSKFRLRAGIEYTLQDAASQRGHVMLPVPELIHNCTRILAVAVEDIEDIVADMINSGELVRVNRDENAYIYLKNYYAAERYIARKLDLLAKSVVPLERDDVDSMISQTAHLAAMEYAPLQREAIAAAVNEGVLVLTGGPGTGKTTVIRAVVQIFERMGLECALCAPTGRAAKRISESVSREASTIHRLLEMEFPDDTNPRFRRDSDNLLEQDVVIVDESSMVDTMLMASLLRAVKPGARVLFIGDADQLPSVGAGNVLADIITSSAIPTVTLTEIFRQAEQSRIIVSAHAINAGKYPVLTDNSGGFYFISTPEQQIPATITDLITRRLPKRYGTEILDAIQVITPSRKGVAGVEELNKLLQESLNPHEKGKPERKTARITFRIGDRVMQIKNNYSIPWFKGNQPNVEEGSGVFNGDIGTVTEISGGTDAKIEVNFDERIVEYDTSMLDELELAYAITIHKSQGSEYPVVIIPLFTNTPLLLTRELLYTAVTRARDMVILVGNEEVMRLMVDNSRRPERYTGLADELRAMN